jgi:hypothetical protein
MDGWMQQMTDEGVSNNKHTSAAGKSPFSSRRVSGKTRGNCFAK